MPKIFYDFSKVLGQTSSKNSFWPKWVSGSRPDACLEGIAPSHGPVCVTYFETPCWWGCFVPPSYRLGFFAVSKEAKSKVAAVPGQQGICVCIKVVCCSEIPCNTKTWGGDVGYVWNEDRMTMFIEQIPHSNSCQLHYCQINSELLPIIHCLAWRQWNGGFASMAEIRVAQPSKESCKVAQEMSNIIWSRAFLKSSKEESLFYTLYLH